MARKEKNLFVFCTTQRTESSFFIYAYSQLAFGSKLFLNVEKIKEQRQEERSKGGSREGGKGKGEGEKEIYA